VNSRRNAELKLPNAAKPDLVKKARALLSASAARTSHGKSKMENNRTTLSDDTLKIIEFCQAAKQDQGDPEKYLDRNRNNIAAAGRMFEFFGLAKPDSSSPLGWKGTQGMMELIADPKAFLPNSPPSYGELAENLIVLMIEASLGVAVDDPMLKESLFCQDCLYKLGLLFKNAHGDLVPQLELLELFGMAAYVRSRA
jgi:hypothetical protein